MASKLADLAASIPMARFLGIPQAKVNEAIAESAHRNHQRKTATAVAPQATETSAEGDRLTPAEQVELEAITQATAAAVAAERLRWSEILSAGIAADLAAYSMYLAKGGMTAKDALAKLQMAKTDIDKTAPKKPKVLTGWEADKAAQLADPNYRTPMQMREERIRRIQAQEQAK